MKNKEALLLRFSDACQAYIDHGAEAGLAAKRELRDEVGDATMAELAKVYKKRKKI